MIQLSLTGVIFPVATVIASEWNERGNLREVGVRTMLARC